MRLERYILHPVLSHPRSRFIFFLFVILSSLLSALCWYRLGDAVAQSGISLDSLDSMHPFIVYLMSPMFRVVMAIFAAVIASGLTAQRVVGPIKRLGEWLQHRRDNKTSSEFRLRKGDVYQPLLNLINKLLNQNS